jgi:hypothetical protein
MWPSGRPKRSAISGRSGDGSASAPCQQRRRCAALSAGMRSVSAASSRVAPPCSPPLQPQNHRQRAVVGAQLRRLHRLARPQVVAQRRQRADHGAQRPQGAAGALIRPDALHGDDAQPQGARHRTHDAQAVAASRAPHHQRARLARQQHRRRLRQPLHEGAGQVELLHRRELLRRVIAPAAARAGRLAAQHVPYLARHAQRPLGACRFGIDGLHQPQLQQRPGGGRSLQPRLAGAAHDLAQQLHGGTAAGQRLLQAGENGAEARVFLHQAGQDQRQAGFRTKSGLLLQAQQRQARRGLRFPGRQLDLPPAPALLPGDVGRHKAQHLVEIAGQEGKVLLKGGAPLGRRGAVQQMRGEQQPIDRGVHGEQKVAARRAGQVVEGVGGHGKLSLGR